MKSSIWTKLALYENTKFSTDYSIHPPSPLQSIARVTSLKVLVLGVTLTDRLSITAHCQATQLQ